MAKFYSARSKTISPLPWLTFALPFSAQLRSKKELIERFIAEHFAALPASADVGAEFDSYWEAQKQSALIALSQDEGLKREALDKVLANYLFTEKTPMRDDVIGIMEKRPALRERRSVADRVIEKIKAFAETFVEGVD